MARKPADDLLKQWRDAFEAEYVKSINDRLSEMTEEGRYEFMRWFVGEAEAREMAPKVGYARPQ